MAQHGTELGGSSLWSSPRGGVNAHLGNPSRERRSHFAVYFSAGFSDKIIPCTLNAGMVGLAFFVTGLGWSGLASFLSNRAGLERAGLGWQVLTKTGLQGFSLA